VEAELVESAFAYSERERVLAYVMSRMEAAWAEEDIEQAQSLNRMYVAYEAMSDEEWDAAYGECCASDR
jgi:hypothetical protein